MRYRRLWGWIEGEYHPCPHRGIDGDTPAERWTASSEPVRFLDPTVDLDDLFLFDATRVVQKDRTVSLHSVHYEIDAAFTGERVTLRFDPAKLGAPVQVWHDGAFIEIARRVDVHANCHVKRAHPSDPAATDPSSPIRWRDLKE